MRGGVGGGDSRDSEGAGEGRGEQAGALPVFDKPVAVELSPVKVEMNDLPGAIGSSNMLKDGVVIGGQEDFGDVVLGAHLSHHFQVVVDRLAPRPVV